jgi:hypothetical protein
MTTEHEASRTLVKSPPELWAECSDAGSLARHLGEFGEITITRLEPETTVAWEGEHASGTVRIEPSGWGTRVTVTAETNVEAPPAPLRTEVIEEVHPESTEAEIEIVEEEHDATVEETLADADPVPVADTKPARARWRRMTGRVRGFFGPGDRADEPDEPDEPHEPANEAAPEPAEPPVDSVPAPEGSAIPPEPEPPTAPPDPPAAEPGPESRQPEPEFEPELDAEAILAAALDSLGQAHHRPFSRA